MSEQPGAGLCVLRRAKDGRVIVLLDLSIPRIGRYLWPPSLMAVGVAVLVQASASRR